MKNVFLPYSIIISYVYYWDNQNKVGQHSDFTLNSFLSNDIIRSLS